MHYLIGLDIGEKRIGVAVSDGMGLGVRAHSTIDVEKFFEELPALLVEYNAKEIVVGLPKHKDGTESEQTQKVRDFVSKIVAAFPDLVLHYEDEILTSSEAKSRLKNRGVKITEANKGLIDSEAAAIILEQYFS